MKADSQRPDVEDVRAFFHYVYGRTPENEAVVREIYRNHKTMLSLRNFFFQSAEFSRIFGSSVSSRGLAMPSTAPPITVEVSASAEQIHRMITVVRRFWLREGGEAPSWPGVPREKIDKADGDTVWQKLDSVARDDSFLVAGTLKRVGVDIDYLRTAVEFGCGGGRTTLQLARLFPQVLGVDFSTPHLAYARSEAVRRGMPHIKWLKAHPENAMPASSFDFWFSRRTLQHNPPPVIKIILQECFNRLSRNGVAIFQVPTYFHSYAFDVESYLSRAAGKSIEYHLLAQDIVFKIAKDANVDVLEVREDQVGGAELGPGWRSNIFCLQKCG